MTRVGSPGLWSESTRFELKCFYGSSPKKSSYRYYYYYDNVLHNERVIYGL